MGGETWYVHPPRLATKIGASDYVTADDKSADLARSAGMAVAHIGRRARGQSGPTDRVGGLLRWVRSKHWSRRTRLRAVYRKLLEP